MVKTLEQLIVFNALQSKTSLLAITEQDIDQIIEKYPAFHSAYLFQSFVLKTNNPNKLKSQLPTIATKVKNRALLHDYIYEKVFFSEEKSTKNSIISKETIKNKEPEKYSKHNISSKEKQEINTTSLTTSIKKASQKKKTIVKETKPLELKKEIKTTKKPISAKELNFLEWLKQTNLSDKEKNKIPIESTSRIEAEMHQEIKASNDPLENFISNQINRKKQQKKKNIKPSPIQQEKKNEPIVSQTFAEVLVLQQKYLEAIEVYSQLGLKYPQKSVYFARQIEKIKNYL